MLYCTSSIFILQVKKASQTAGKLTVTVPV
jgi:hypothetical protein